MDSLPNLLNHEGHEEEKEEKKIFEKNKTFVFFVSFVVKDIFFKLTVGLGNPKSASIFDKPDFPKPVILGRILFFHGTLRKKLNRYKQQFSLLKTTGRCTATGE